MSDDLDMFRHVARELLFTYMTERGVKEKPVVCGAVVKSLMDTGMDVSDQTLRTIDSEFDAALGFVREQEAQEMVDGVLK